MTLSDNLDTTPNVEEQSQSVADSFAPGQLVAGKYKVISLIGKGGMGSVYKVNQVLLDKEYALKTVNSITVSDTQIRRFHAEAKMTSSLSHPNLVQVHDFGVLECGNPYLIMDFVEGITLAEHLRLHGPLTAEKAALIMGQACLGLFYSHNNGVIHRDLKPGNIMLAHGFAERSEGSVRIVDFGIAKIIRSDEGQLQALTRTGEIFGSPLYMSPEQCSGSPVDHRSDIYSLGCVLLEALTGTPPHVGQNAMATMMSHLSDTAPTLKQASMGLEFEESIERIVAKMLEKSPSNRYQNLGAVAYDLSEATAGGSNRMRRAIAPVLVKARKARDETISLKKTDFYKILGLSILTTAVVSAFSSYLILKYKWQPDQVSPSASIPYSSEYATADKVVSERIEEGEQARSQVIDRVRHPISGKVKLREINIDATILEEISKSKSIRYLDITGCGIGNAGVKELRKLPHLLEVSAIKTNFDDAGALGLVGCDRLRALKLSRTAIKEDGILSLAKLPELELVDLSSTDVTDRCLKELAKLTKLRTLDVSSNQKLSSEGIAVLANSDIHNLKLDSTKINDQGLQKISRMPMLTEISLCSTGITASGLRSLLKNKSIRFVYLADCPHLKESEIIALEKQFSDVQFFVSQSNDTTGFGELLKSDKI